MHIDQLDEYLSVEHDMEGGIINQTGAFATLRAAIANLSQRGNAGMSKGTGRIWLECKGKDRVLVLEIRSRNEDPSTRYVQYDLRRHMRP